MAQAAARLLARVLDRGGWVMDTHPPCGCVPSIYWRDGRPILQAVDTSGCDVGDSGADWWRSYSMDVAEPQRPVCPACGDPHPRSDGYGWWYCRLCDHRWREPA